MQSRYFALFGIGRDNFLIALYHLVDFWSKMGNKEIKQ